MMTYHMGVLLGGTLNITLFGACNIANIIPQSDFENCVSLNSKRKKLILVIYALSAVHAAFGICSYLDAKLCTPKPSNLEPYSNRPSSLNFKH